MHQALRNWHLGASLVLDKLASCPKQRSSINLDAENDDDYTSLALAIEYNLGQAANGLIMLGADANRTSSFDRGRSPLHLAELLTLRRLDMGQRDEYERTAIMDTARMNPTECVKLLVDAGANLDAENVDHYTPLYHAASKRYEEFESCSKRMPDSAFQPNCQVPLANQWI